MIATCFALVGFACASILGIAAGNVAITTLWRALGVMVACWLVGRVIGVLLQRTIEDHVIRYKKDHPIEGEPETLHDKADSSETSATPRETNPMAGPV